MAEWDIRSTDLKKYPHFDPVISTEKAKLLATNITYVAQHAFYPFMLYEQRWNRFAKKGDKGKPKIRPIRYAARVDAYIFSRYRHMLAARYEAELLRTNLNTSILAYRRIIDDKSGHGKCNIHFARDAFEAVKSMEDCFVVALDISSFFESIDHERLKALWCRLLNLEKLPPDHFKVFKAITNYAVVDKQSVYERLGHFGEKRQTKAGCPIKGYLTPYRKMPKQLCSGADFRQKIKGENGSKSLIKKNHKPYGIPQGAPISDLLANFSLLDFDIEVSSVVSAFGGRYFRYSDDILIIGPGDGFKGLKIMSELNPLIRVSGPKLSIKPEKSSVFHFTKCGENQSFKLMCGTQGRNGLEYLGFRYNGKNVYLRDATLSNLKRKITSASKRDAYRCAKRYSDKDFDQLQSVFDYERLIKRFGKVEEFGEIGDDYRNWTFWTYARRAAEVFGPTGQTILRQLRKHSLLIRQRADHDLACAIDRRHSSQFSRKT